MKITQQTIILAMAFLQTASVCAQAESPNLLRNGSFEAGRYGWMLDARPLDATFTVERNRGVGVLTAGPRCQKAVLASEWLPLDAGVDYTLGISLRAEGAELPVRVMVWSWAEADGKWNEKTESAQTFRVTDQWQRFYLNAKLEPARAGKYQVAVQLDNPGAVQITEVSLVKGAQAAVAYLPHSEVEMGLESSRPDCLFDSRETPSINLTFHNAKEEEIEADLNIVVTDLEDREVLDLSDSITMPARTTTDKTVKLPVEKKGYYRVTAELTDGERKRRCGFAFAVIDKYAGPPATDSYFGVAMASHNLERQLDRAADLGVGHVRVHESLNWGRIESEEGVFIWPEAEAAYDAYRAKGFDVLVYLDGGAKGVPAWAKTMDAKEQNERYGDFFAKAVDRYKGIISDVEIINEPWAYMTAEEYADVVRAVYSKAKEAAPSVNIAGVTAYHGPQIDFVRKITRTDALEHMDVFTLHPYPRPARPEMLIDALEQTNLWLGEAGWRKPVWITEMGWTTSGRQPLPTNIPRPPERDNTELEQAMYLVRSNIIAIAHGVDRFYWFYYSGDNNWFYPYDMFECDSNDSVMKSVPVYSAMTTRLRGYRFEKILSEGPGGVYAYLFTNGTNRQIVAWSRADVDTGLLLGNAGTEPEVYDMVGNRINGVRPVDPLVYVPLSGKPVYVALSDGKSMPTVASRAHVEVHQQGSNFRGNLTLSNLFPGETTFEAELVLPESSELNEEFGGTFTLEEGMKLDLPFSFSITDPKTKALYDDVVAHLKLTRDGESFAFTVAATFVYAKPLTARPANILVEGVDFRNANFDPDPLWVPDLVRSYAKGGPLLRRTGVGEKGEGEVEYVFHSDKEEQLHFLMACSRLPAGQDSIRWSLNDEGFVSASSAARIGSSWVYSIHPHIWWRFECAWHDMGPVTVKAGENKLRIRYVNPVEDDYGYVAIDVLAFVSAEDLAAYEESESKPARLRRSTDTVQPQP